MSTQLQPSEVQKVCSQYIVLLTASQQTSFMLSSVHFAVTPPWCCMLGSYIGVFPCVGRSICVLPDWGTTPRSVDIFNDLGTVLTSFQFVQSGNALVADPCASSEKPICKTCLVPLCPSVWTSVHDSTGILVQHSVPVITLLFTFILFVYVSYCYIVLEGPFFILLSKY